MHRPGTQQFRILQIFTRAATHTSGVSDPTRPPSPSQRVASSRTHGQTPSAADRRVTAPNKAPGRGNPEVARQESLSGRPVPVAGTGNPVDDSSPKHIRPA
eukprot:jgi/Tetstr1/447927/TSEL_035234.t1